ncbi:DNA (cytosine-5-)-methyltransferase [Dyadobacter sp.]|uniref:DNA (cytosine-5-)-methyltransferase n=1 Tax=Dyadobacter sp. TaxID=1914288 RepID=UPI0025C6BC51|nr:DNA (cytosine-5-)-methyltransferase [Dyadobacter sp.]
MGWINVFHCEWNPFGQKVLNHYWPDAISYNDITKTDFAIHRGSIDIISGGFPCQPYSTAGKRLGKEDNRHLWPEMLRAIREIQPSWVVGENVRGLTNWNGGLVFDEVQADLENEGYEVTPFLLPACAVGAPHRRDRIWFVAHSSGIRCERNICAGQGIQWSQQARGKIGAGGNSQGPASYAQSERFGEARPDFSRSEEWITGSSSERPFANPNKFDGNLSGFRTGEVSQFETSGIRKDHASDSDSQQRRERRLYATQREAAERHIGAFDPRNGRGAWEDFPTQSPVRSGNDGFPSGLDGITVSKWRNESIKAAGNAIVPQVAYQIFKAIQHFHDCKL